MIDICLLALFLLLHGFPSTTKKGRKYILWNILYKKWNMHHKTIKQTTVLSDWDIGQKPNCFTTLQNYGYLLTNCITSNKNKKCKSPQADLVQWCIVLGPHPHIVQRVGHRRMRLWPVANGIGCGTLTVVAWVNI